MGQLTNKVGGPLGRAGIGVATMGMSEVPFLADDLGLFGSKQGGFSSDQLQYQIDQRRIAINTFGEQLAQARQRYLSRLQNLQNLTVQRFGPDLSAQLAGKGFSVGGGAFNSALAKRIADLQAEGELAGANMEREDLTNIAGMHSGAYSSSLDARLKMYGMEPQVDPLMQGVGQFAGKVGGDWLSEYLKNKYPGTPSQPSRSVYSGGGSGGNNYGSGMRSGR